MMELATFAGGCFWCTEAVFLQLKGVHSVVSGFTGGTIKNPAYREVCTGRTGHAEGVQIRYDSTIINYVDLLEIFFATHDPTTKDRQGNDVGPHYRSAVFYHNETQKEMVTKFIEQLELESVFEASIVTEIAPFEAFYEAEEVHQNYYNLNKAQPYCHYIITPKINKVKTYFKDKLKEI